MDCTENWANELAGQDTFQLVTIIFFVLVLYIYTKSKNKV